MSFDASPLRAWSIALIGAFAIAFAAPVAPSAAAGRATQAAHAAIARGTAERGRTATRGRATIAANRVKAAAAQPLEPATRLTYPAARRSSVSEIRFGHRVGDPYRWLENPRTAESRAWLDAERKLAQGHLAALPTRAAFQARISAIFAAEDERQGRKRFGDVLAFETRRAFKTRIHVTGVKGGRPRVVFDEAELPKGYKASGWAFSPDGRHLAYGLTASGTDIVEWRIRDVATGRDRVDHVQWSKFSNLSWLPDSSGFLYSRVPEAAPGRALTTRDRAHRVYYHRVGTPQYEDVVIVDRPGRSRWHVTARSIGDQLVITTSKGSGGGTRVELTKLRDRKVRQRLVDFAEGEASLLGVEEDTAGGLVALWYQTNQGADRGRIVRIDPAARPGRRTRTIVREGAEPLRDAVVLDDAIVAVYLKDAAPILRVFDRAGAPQRELALPGVGEVTNLKAGRRPGRVRYTFSSLLVPPTDYEIDLASGRTTRIGGKALRFDPDAFEMRQVVVTSRDGTRLPMFVVHKKGLALDGSNPTYLYSYGGFHTAMAAGYRGDVIPWLEAGGVFALPILRGGGEGGEAWHDAGTRTTKQNTFDDFIAAAEWLIGSGLTSPAKLAIGGRSNGGLLVGATMIQRPDLFAAAVPEVGVLDSLRYDQFTVGGSWTHDYGSPTKPDEFAALAAYSPVHNVRPGTRYPATLVVTGDHDDRVVPAHSYKFAAALQHAQAGPAPVVLSVTRDAGHGNAGPTADRWAFLAAALGMGGPTATTPPAR